VLSPSSVLFCFFGLSIDARILPSMLEESGFLVLSVEECSRLFVSTRRLPYP
jgi:hypothetical protein